MNTDSEGPLVSKSMQEETFGAMGLLLGKEEPQRNENTELDTLDLR
jgi:hypothetical protein